MTINGKPQISSVIIADDDPDDQLLIREAFEQYHMPPELRIVDDGLQLMQQLALPGMPDMVLLDLNMPNRNGIECLEEIRSTRRLDDLVVVVLSTSKNIRDIEMCYQHGAHLFFPKPYTFDCLCKLMASILDINWADFSRLSERDFIKAATQGFPELHPAGKS